MISTAPAQVTQPQLVVATTTAALPESHSSPLSGNALSVETPDTEPVSEEEKKHIYKHPLFPLLALLFEKCEQATQTPDCPPCDSFDNDIQSFVAHQEQDQRPFFSEDTDLDALMVKAIQVLRIHLLELEKVNELCKDFCNRYIACLKGKLHSENLLRNELGFDDDFSISSPPSAQTSPIGVQQQSGLLATVSGSNVVIQQNVAQPSVSMATLSQGQIVSGGTVYQMVQTPQGLVAQPIQIQTGGSSVATAQTPGNVAVQGSTPLSQIGVPTTPVQNQGSLPSLSSTPLTMGSGDEDDDIGGKRRNKRGVLPKSATQVMRSWLFQHIVHPYPSEDEKRQIAQQTNLTLLQVNNWFINARRRILQPMLDASNPDQAKAKKNKPQTRPAQRFWPDSIANLQPQPKPSASEESAQGSDLPTASTASTSDTIVKSPTTIAIPTQTGLSQQIVLPPGTIITADGQILTTAAAPNGGGGTVAFTTSTSLAPSVQVTSIAAPTTQFISVSADGSSSIIKAEPSPQLNLDDSSDDSLGD